MQELIEYSYFPFVEGNSHRIAFTPRSTYVIFPKITSLKGDAERLCNRIREHARGALVPGAPRWFAAGSAGHVRILKEAFDRMEPVINGAGSPVRAEEMYENLHMPPVPMLARQPLY